MSALPRAFLGAQEVLRRDEPVAPDDDAYWTKVRALFPLSAERVYLNTAGLGASPGGVLDAWMERTRELEEMCEVGRSKDLWSSVKGKAARLLGCDPDEVAFTRNATEGCNIVTQGLPLRSGDEIVTTTHEHVGNLIPLLARSQRDGLRLVAFDPLADSKEEVVDRLKAAITERTRMISIPHVTCSTGQVLPVNEIGEIATERGLWYFVDGAQSAGMIDVDVRAMRCDAYATSGHKWLIGPKGTGLLYVRKDALDAIEPIFVGAYSDSGEIGLGKVLRFHPTAQRYEYGTVNAPLVLGLGAALDVLFTVGLDNVTRHNRFLAMRLADGLRDLGAEVVTPMRAGEHGSLVTFRVAGKAYSEVQSTLAREHRLRTRGVYEGGVKGVRISLHLYNSARDVERVLEGVAAL